MERESNNMVVFHLETQKARHTDWETWKNTECIAISGTSLHPSFSKRNKLSVVVNVGNYREKRQEIIQRLADRTAEKVKRTGQPVF